MSIETVEIRAFSGPSVVEINGSDQPAIVEINQGPAGGAGPNEVTTATTTDLTGYIFGDGSFIAGATTATADPDPSTLVMRDSLGEAEFEGLRVNPGGSPDGDFDVGGGVFNVDMQTLSASCSGTFTALDLQATTATVSGTLTANHIHGNLAGAVYAHVRAGEVLAKGDPVYISGSHGTGANLIAIVSKADASDPLKMPAVGVMDAAVANNANGHMVITGTISDINTATYSVNAELYVAEGGGFTATPPSAHAQPVARVERSNSNNGAVIVKVNGLSASDATGNTLVRRTSTGGASFGSLTLTSALALSSGGTGGTTAGTARTNLGLGTADTPTFSNLTLATGTITVPQPLAFTQTWNSTATFTALQMDITDSGPANAASLLMDLRVGGVSRFRVGSSSVFIPTSSNFSCGRIDTSGVDHVASGTTQYSTSLKFGSASSLAWMSGSTWASGSTDLILFRDATGTLAQRNGTNAQTFRVYGTYTGSTNFERLNIGYNATATAYQIGTEKGTGGGTARALELQTDATTRMYVHPTNGRVGIGTSAPDQLLHVNGTIKAYSNVQLAVNAVIQSVSTSGAQGLTLIGSAGTPNSYVEIRGTSANSTTDYIKLTGGNNGANEIARFLGSGNAGIGTSSPASRLTVTGGDAEVTDSASGLILKSPNGTRYRIKVNDAGALTTTAI